MYKEEGTHSESLEATTVLHSYEEFLVWYLGRQDFSIFSTSDIQGLIEDVRPSVYPCIPVVKVGELDVFVYLRPEQLKTWHTAVVRGDEQR